VCNSYVFVQEKYFIYRTRIENIHTYIHSHDRKPVQTDIPHFAL